jgi:hypothetical protein
MPQIELDDPVLDSRHAFTRVFLAAEYWKRKYVSLKTSMNTSDDHELVNAYGNAERGRVLVYSGASPEVIAEWRQKVIDTRTALMR